MRVWILAAALLANCTAIEDEAALPAVSVEPAGGGFPAASGEANLVVRSVAAGGGMTREVAGADCRLASTLYSAEFTTPARLLVPSFGLQSPELRIDCAASEGRGAALVRPYFRRTNGLGGWPAIGVSASSGGDVGVSLGGWWNGGWGWDNPRTLVVEYPSVQVRLQ
jgi:hypothetical protein